MTLLLGVDIGSTVTKASLFDHSGVLVASGRARCRPLHPRPGWIERDMDAVFDTAVAAIRDCLAAAGPGAEVTAVGVVGHSDGLYPVDASGCPVRNAIMATDSRAVEVLRRWAADGLMPEVLALTGTEPFAASPATLLAWLRTHEPASIANSRWFFAAKDWVRYRLTGHVGAEPTDASGSFLDVRTRNYSARAIAAYGLETLASKLPPLSEPASLVGTVTAEASALTGLPAGTPVVAGAHDVDAAALGMGAHRTGALSVIVGTFSINQIVTDQVVLGAGWQLRPFLQPGRWLAMSTSPASAANLDWYAATVDPSLSFASLVDEAAALTDDDPGPYFLPFINGGPGFGGPAGAFLGLGSHHRRAHLVRSVLRGIVANHRRHVETLGAGFTLPGEVYVGGGGAQSAYWLSLMADALAARVRASDGNETARGAAMLAGLGVGVWPDLDAAAAAVQPVRTLEPDDAGAARFNAYYASYMRAVEAVRHFSA